MSLINKSCNNPTTKKKIIPINDESEQFNKLQIYENLKKKKTEKKIMLLQKIFLIEERLDFQTLMTDMYAFINLAISATCNHNTNTLINAQLYIHSGHSHPNHASL